MITTAIICVAAVMIASIIAGSRTTKAEARAIVRATEVAFSTDATQQAARDAAVRYLSSRGAK